MTEATDGLSKAEQDYFNSRGESGLEVHDAEELSSDEPEESGGAIIPEEIVPEDDADEGEAEGAEEQAKAPKTVPLAALTKERQAAKELKAKLAEMEKQQAILNDRWETLLRATEAPKAEEKAPVDEDPEPDPNQDIFAHNAWLKRQLLKTQQGITEQQKAQQRAAQEQEAEQAVWNVWQASTANYSQKQADFPDAAKHLAGLRAGQLKALGYSEAQVNATINAELKGVIVEAARSQRDPAEIIYQYALASGYTPKQAKAAAEEALDRVEKGVAGATSLSNAGGAPAKVARAADIANMSEREFEAWMKKNGPSAFRRLAGG